MGERTCPPADARFWSKVLIAGPDDCWPWQAAKTKGHGVLRRGATKNYYAHRVAYEDAKGPIPVGTEIDHVCHNRDKSCNLRDACPHRACCNPAHLEAVSHKENVNRRPGGLAGTAAIHAAKTHCKNGHPFAGANLIQRPTQRRCRTCKNESERRRTRRLRRQKADRRRARKGVACGC